MALIDFVISTLSVIVIGGVVYAFSSKVRQAHGSPSLADRQAEAPASSRTARSVPLGH